ncbi:MAG: nucleotide exchange factor GrpE [Alphaproteobacteria bacterium]|nr:nucleotide exchange factor GrpE [Alphaproteobacteria bacterium]
MTDNDNDGSKAANDSTPIDPTVSGEIPAVNDNHVGKIAELETKVTELKDQLLRALAETENVRRRAQREVEDTAKYAMSKFATDVVNLPDNLRRALDSISAEAIAGNDTIKALHEGVSLAERECLAILERHGIKRVSPLGERFDHNLHQALLEIDDPTREPGTVAQVIQPGYTIAGRLLRPAMVGVVKRPPAAGAAPAAGGGAVDTKA